jgi:hypothetical protein
LPSISDQEWLNLETVAALELTSEDEGHPIEAALSSRDRQGWRAADPGAQTIRLIFDQPQRLRRIKLVFNETETSRTQEFVLCWCSEADEGFREIVRQQWNFSPPQTAREIEDYQVDLASVKVLELAIVPDISGGRFKPSACFRATHTCVRCKASSTTELLTTSDAPTLQSEFFGHADTHEA